MHTQVKKRRSTGERTDRHPSTGERTDHHRTVRSTETIKPPSFSRQDIQSTLGNQHAQQLVKSGQLTTGNDRAQEREAERTGTETESLVTAANREVSNDSPRIAATGNEDSLQTANSLRLASAVGQRFDGVRIHDDERADVLNRAFHANALTYGNDIYFAKGAYRPERASGAGLLAHELIHVMQQRESSSARVQRQALPAASGQAAEYVLMEPYTGAGMELPAGTTVYEVPGGGQTPMISVTLPPPWRNAGEVFSVPPQILRPVGVPQSGAGQQSATQLTNTQRGALLTQLSHRLGAASEDFRQAANQVVDDLRAEAAEKAELISLLVSVATVFVVPRLSASITRLIDKVPASASVTTHRAALALMNEADNIAGAIGEVVKETSKREISTIVQRQSGDFFEQLHEGYQAYTDNILGYVSRNIENREVLPDAKLWLYVANWDVRAISPSLFKPRIRNVWNRYESQVLAIEDTVVYDMITGGGGTRTFAAEVRLRNGERRMALLRTRSAAGFTGSMEWVRWIDDQFEEAARARNEAEGFNRNIVVDASEVEDLP